MRLMRLMRLMKLMRLIDEVDWWSWWTHKATCWVYLLYVGMGWMGRDHWNTELLEHCCAVLIMNEWHRNDGMTSEWWNDMGMVEWHQNDGMTSKWWDSVRMRSELWNDIRIMNFCRKECVNRLSPTPLQRGLGESIVALILHSFPSRILHALGLVPIEQGWAEKAFWLPGTGREIENPIPVLREGNGN